MQTILPEVEVVDPSGYTGSGWLQPSTVTAYDARGLVAEVQDANGTRTRSTYDGRGRLVAAITDLDGDGLFEPGFDGDDAVACTHYDLAGRPIRALDSRGAETVTVYDRAGRVIEVVGAEVYDAENGGTAQPVTTTVYDPAGNVLEGIDARGVVTRTEYDELHRPRFVTAAWGTAEAATTETRYDPNGNADELILWNGVDPQATTRGYDAFDRMVIEVQPDVGDNVSRETAITYTLDGQVRTRTDPNGEMVAYTYDGAGRVVASEHFDGSPSLEEVRELGYDRAGNLLQVNDGQGTSAYVYDALNRVLEETRTYSFAAAADHTVVSAYDAAGNRTRVTYPDTGRELTSAYDRQGRLVQIDDAAHGTTTFEWDRTGHRTSCAMPNGVATAYTYDALGRVLTSITTGPGGLVHGAEHGYDLVGHRVTVTEETADLGAVSYVYSYDARYQLVVETWSGGGRTVERWPSRLAH